MKTRPVGESDAWYPAPQLTAPERAMLENAIALGFPRPRGGPRDPAKAPRWWASSRARERLTARC